MSLHYRPLPGKHEPRKLHLLTKTLLLLYNQTQNIFRPLIILIYHLVITELLSYVPNAYVSNWVNASCCQSHSGCYILSAIQRMVHAAQFKCCSAKLHFLRKCGSIAAKITLRDLLNHKVVKILVATCQSAMFKNQAASGWISNNL